MFEHNKSPEQWIENEDASQRQARIERLNWLVASMPDVDFQTFSGGPLAVYLFEEARYSFVYAQFLAVVVLGLAFIERTLAALFMGMGRDDLERRSMVVLLAEAVKVGFITDQERQRIEKARKLRNPITHFRTMLDPESIVYRAIAENRQPYALLEDDAREVMGVVLHLLGNKLLAIQTRRTS